MLMHEIRLKRVYEVPSPDDGGRVLVDRLWPRGIRKADLPYDAWPKEITPSPELRKLYHRGCSTPRRTSRRTTRRCSQPGCARRAAPKAVREQG